MKNVFGGIMMGCGILVAGLAGLCTLLAAGSALIDTSTQDAREFAMMLPAVLIAGGIPLAMGLGLFFGGRALMKSPSPPPVEPPVPPEQVRRAAPPENPLPPEEQEKGS